MPIDFLAGLVGLVLTLLIFSYLIRDNPLFRLATYLFIGVSSGYAAAATKTGAGTDVTTGVSGLGFIKEIDMSTPEPLLSIGTRKVSLLEVIGFKN